MKENKKVKKALLELSKLIDKTNDEVDDPSADEVVYLEDVDPHDIFSLIKFVKKNQDVVMTWDDSCLSFWKSEADALRKIAVKTKLASQFLAKEKTLIDKQNKAIKKLLPVETKSVPLSIKRAVLQKYLAEHKVIRRQEAIEWVDYRLPKYIIPEIKAVVAWFKDLANKVGEK